MTHAPQYSDQPKPTFFRRTIGPLLLMLLCPPVAVLIWYTNVFLGGSVGALATLFQQNGVLSTIYDVWAPFFFGSKTAWMTIACYASFQLMLMKIVPGPRFEGPITPKGNVPVYKANGVACFFLTLAAYMFFSYGLKIFSPTLIYDEMGYLIGALNSTSLLLCLFLYFKGRYRPSSTDSGSSGHFLFDFYWGTELYPRVAGWNIKMFSTCRFGMMGWSLLLLSFAAKQSELYGLTNGMLIAVTLQLIYVTKFFLWETGYLRSLDIMHDRAGFYICWGCFVWLPVLYTSPTLYLVNHPIELSSMTAGIIFTIGAAAILTNFAADRQRQKVRAADGLCKVWGKPAQFTRAAYTTARGDIKENVLLACGWWGIARHFHYVLEIIGTLCWSLPALFSNFLPYFYLVFLTILLLERATRDDRRCSHKYGPAWEEHCKKVRYRVLPGIW